MDESVLASRKEKNSDIDFFLDCIVDPIKTSFLNDELDLLKTVNLDLAG